MSYDTTKVTLRQVIQELQERMGLQVAGAFTVEYTDGMVVQIHSDKDARLDQEIDRGYVKDVRPRSTATAGIDGIDGQGLEQVRDAEEEPGQVIEIIGEPSEPKPELEASSEDPVQG